ncbi:MAG TPA: hypothetical protein DCF73_11705 [Rhodobiaceae bacterium]|nr:hypothetical protein [Rhodobiaceae bacterium]
MTEVAANTIKHGDCVMGMQELPEACADLVICDPPYNLNKDFGEWKEKDRKAEWLPWCKSWLAECDRILRPGGNIFVYGIHHHLCWIQCHMYQMGLTYRRQIIWYYENGFAGYRRSLAAHYEPLLWFSKGEDYTYDPIREPYKSTERLKHKITKNGKVWTPHPEGRLASRSRSLSMPREERPHTLPVSALSVSCDNPITLPTSRTALRVR